MHGIVHNLAATFVVNLSGLPAIISITAILTVPMFVRYVSRYVVFRTRVRSIKQRSTVIPEYQAPPGIPPAFFGTMVDNRPSGHDLMATLLSLHLKGYLHFTYDKSVGTYTIAAQDKNADTLYEHERFLHGLVAALPLRTMRATDYPAVIFPRAGEFNVAVQRGLQRDGYYFFHKDIDNLNAGQFTARMLGRSLIKGVIKPWNWPGFVLSVVFFPFGIAWAILSVWFYLRLGLFGYRTKKWERAWPEIAGYYNYLQVVEAPKRNPKPGQDLATFTILEHDPYLVAAQFEKQWESIFSAGHEVGAGGKEYQTYRA